MWVMLLPWFVGGFSVSRITCYSDIFKGVGLWMEQLTFESYLDPDLDTEFVLCCMRTTPGKRV